MPRNVFLAVLSLLLVTLQQQWHVHPISHLTGHAGPEEPALSSPHSDEACVECALLAGGFNAAIAGSPPEPDGAPGAGLVFHAYRSRAAEVPAWFQTRAPPVLP